jgi:centrosomal protein CEP120
MTSHDDTRRTTIDPPQLTPNDVEETTTTTIRREHLASREHIAPSNIQQIVSIRETDEYRAAWDVEVWKALQVKQFQAEFKESKRKETEAFRKTLEVKEKETLAKVDRQERELLTRERRIVEEEKLLERRRQKLVEQEKDVKSVQQKLEEHRRALDAEAELRVQRVKEDLAHRLELFQQKLAHSEDNTRRFEERLHASQGEYMKLFEEFSNFKTQQLANPDVHAAAQVERLRTDHNLEMMSLQDRLDRRHQEQIMSLTHRSQQLDSQVTTLSTALASKKQSAHSRGVEIAKLSTSLQHAEKQIEELRKDKQLLEAQLMSTTQRLETIVGSAVSTHNDAATRRGTQPSSSEAAALRQSIAATCEGQQSVASSKRSVSNGHRGMNSFSDAQMALRAEIGRLEKERGVLLEETGGAYSTSSPLVQSIDRKILELHHQCVLPVNGGTRR